MNFYKITFWKCEHERLTLIEMINKTKDMFYFWSLCSRHHMPYICIRHHMHTVRHHMHTPSYTPSHAYAITCIRHHMYTPSHAYAITFIRHHVRHRVHTSSRAYAITYAILTQNRYSTRSPTPVKTCPIFFMRMPKIRHQYAILTPYWRHPGKFPRHF